MEIPLPLYLYHYPTSVIVTDLFIHLCRNCGRVKAAHLSMHTLIGLRTRRQVCCLTRPQFLLRCVKKYVAYRKSNKREVQGDTLVHTTFFETPQKRTCKSNPFGLTHNSSAHNYLSTSDEFL